MSDLKSVKILIHGVVQGVFFRSSAMKEANKLRITGWIKNRSDSTVEVIAEGTKDDLEKLINWAKQGPTQAKVERIDVEWKAHTGKYKNFNIEHY